MIRKLTLLLLLFVGISTASRSQIIRDSVYIYMPPGTDTTCPGTQLKFIAIQSNDTFTTTQYHWYTNTTYTGVSIDTFYTTALADGDSVYCYIYFINSIGAPDSFRSNTIIIHRSTSFAPRVIISLTTGSNPDCEGNPLTFTAYPVNGGSSPTYQWLINGLPIPGQTGVTITSLFTAGDTVSVQMIGNSTCSFPFTDTVESFGVVISHDSLHATITVSALNNPICAGVRDSFWAEWSNAGVGATLAWYVDSVLIPTAIGPEYVTDTLHDGDLVYAILTAPDHCVENHTTVSNIITMTVIAPLPTTAWIVLTSGANPGCLDSPVTFTGHYTNFGLSPSYDWYVNGVLVANDTTVFTSLYLNHDQVEFRVHANAPGCYTDTTVTTPTVVMIRDSTPTTPWLSLIDNQLVVNNGGNYIWYFATTNTYTGTIMPGVVSEFYNPHAVGYYYVVKDTGNCPSLPSNIIYISLLDVKNISMPKAKLFPNPTTGILNLDFAEAVNMDFEVYNILGQSMLKGEIKGQSHKETDLSHLPDGSYMVVLRGEDGSKATYKVHLSK